MTQGNLFEQMQTAPAQPKPAASEAVAEQARLSRQCSSILNRLRRGRATNSQLVLLALRFGGRIHELRHAGYDIRIVEENRGDGVFVYALFEDGKEI